MIHLSGGKLEMGQRLGAVGAHGRDGAEQLLGVGVLGVGEDCGDRAGFDDLAVAHDGNAAGYLADDGEVVAGEEHGQLALALEGFEQVENLGLNGDVERSGRLVGEQQIWLVDEGHGDQNALALAAGELVWIVVEASSGIGNGDGFEGLDRLFMKRGAANLRTVGANGLGDLAANCHDRVERSHRLLKDHGDLAAAQGAHGLVGQTDEFPALPADGSLDARRGTEQSENGQGGDAFARAGLADQAQDLAAPQSEAYAANNFRSAEADAEVANFEQRRVGAALDRVRDGAPASAATGS